MIGKDKLLKAVQELVSDALSYQAVRSGERHGNILFAQKRLNELINDLDIPNVTWDENRNQEELCTCGHPYYRHFDTYYDMYPIGCKYCQCREFRKIEA